jgi:hypothetical protein
MPRFRNAPSRRRQPAPTAKWLVLGLTEARLVALRQRTTHLLPVKPSHHRRRFHEGQRLAVKAYVGGPTECHVVVTAAQRVQLGHVDYAAVRELGYIHVDMFRIAWMWDHDREWCADAHALDRTDRGGLPAARSEEGYTDNPARAMGEEMPAVLGDAWEQHIGRPARVRETQRQAMIHANRITQTTSERLAAARAAAQAKGFDMRDEFRRYDRLVLRERHADALDQLALIESRVYPRRAAA